MQGDFSLTGGQARLIRALCKENQPGWASNESSNCTFVSEVAEIFFSEKHIRFSPFSWCVSLITSMVLKFFLPVEG